MGNNHCESCESKNTYQGKRNREAKRGGEGDDRTGRKERERQTDKHTERKKE